MGIAAVVMERGDVVAAVFKWCAGGIKGGEVEGEALCLGLGVAEQLRCKEAVIISDSLDVVYLALLGCDRKGVGASWLGKCKRLKDSKPGWIIKHVMREDNELADKVAPFAFETKSSWLNPWAIPMALAFLLS